MRQLFHTLDFGTAECTVVITWIVFLSRARLQFACWYCHKRYVREENHDRASAHFSLHLMDMHSNKKLTKGNLSVSCIGGDGELLRDGIQGSEQPVCSKSLWNSVKPGISAWQRERRMTTKILSPLAEGQNGVLWCPCPGKNTVLFVWLCI